MVRRINYASGPCRSELHATCPYLLNVRRDRLSWCTCVCHHEPVQSRIRADRATRALFERTQGAPVAAGISAAETPEPMAASAEASPSPRVPGWVDEAPQLEESLDD